MDATVATTEPGRIRFLKYFPVKFLQKLSVLGLPLLGASFEGFKQGTDARTAEADIECPILST